jgi:heat shock protein HslJ
MKKFTIVLLVALLVAVAVWLTQCQEEKPAEQVTVEQAPVEQAPAEEKPVELTPTEKTLARLKNATYMGIQEKDPVTLTNGLWVGEPSQEGGSSRPSVYYVRDFLLEGDIDGNGTDEAAVLLAASSGGTGVNIYLAAVRITGDKLENLDTVLVGDRVQIRKAGFGAKHIFLELVQAGPDDAMSNPGELNMVGWNLVNDKLVPLQVTTKPRRLSLETISESAWALRWWGMDEPATAEPAITLSLKDGNLGGSSGCNSYFMEAKTGAKPGDLSMGPSGGTMKACPEDVMAVEKRYLAQMAGVKRYGFLAGMLAFSYEVDGTRGVMLFERQKIE